MKRSLFACVPTAVRRSRTCVLLLALATGIPVVSVFAQTLPNMPTSNGDTDYLFVPGHGLTGRTTGNSAHTLAYVVGEALRINADKDKAGNILNPGYGPKISFVEEAYTWDELQPTRDGPVDIGRLAADLHYCRENGLFLRVFLSTHKYDESFPKWVIEDGHTQLVKTANCPEPVIRLNNPATYAKVAYLYQEVIRQVKLLGGQDKLAFYGFVLQEPYLGKVAPSPDDWGFIEEDYNAWFNNLRTLHDNLAVWLKDVGGPPNTTKKHRLFWQMINYPADVPEGETHSQTWEIVAQMPVGGGICGPDTFPGEPHLGNAPQQQNQHAFEKGLRDAYDMIKLGGSVNANPAMPTSLHVYRLNYIRAYQGGRDPEFVITPQPIWNEALDDTDANDCGIDDTVLAPMGIANFLGCVPNPHAASLRVNNVVWSIAEGPEDGNLGGYTPWKGWREVQEWMRTTNAVPSTTHGSGCKNATPASIVRP